MTQIALYSWPARGPACDRKQPRLKPHRQDASGDDGLPVSCRPSASCDNHDGSLSRAVAYFLSHSTTLVKTPGTLVYPTV